MERLTGGKYQSFVESYVSIYDNDSNDVQEKENIQEFLQIIDELVEEGYDLSEFNYDALYEYYLEEGKGKVALELIKSGIRSALKMPSGAPIRKTLTKGALEGGARTITKVASDVSKLPIAAAKSAYGKVKDVVKAHPLKSAAVGALSAYDISKGEKSLIGKATTAAGQGLSAANKAVYGDSQPTVKQQPTENKSSQQNQRNPFGLKKEDVDVSSHQKSLLEEPKIGEKNKEGKVWTGTDFGYQSQATIDKQKASQKATSATQQRIGLGVVKGGGKSGYTISTSDKPKTGETDQQWQARRSEALKLADKLNKGEGLGKYRKPATATASTTPAAPKPAAPVLSKLGGVEGTGVGKDFKAKAWSDTERQRYSSATATTKTAPSKPAAPSAMATWAKANKPMIQKVGTPQQKDILKSVESGGKTPMPSVRPISKDIEDIRAMRTASQLRQQGANVTSSDIKNVSVEKPKPIKASYEYDAYDLVLEYLMETGQVDTISEAHYVMLEMDSQAIGSIVEAKRKSYSAKKARKGEDIGLPGKGFAKIAKSAGERYGSKERGEKVAGAVLAGLRAKYGK